MDSSTGDHLYGIVDELVLVIQKIGLTIPTEVTINASFVANTYPQCFCAVLERVMYVM